jgi:cobalt-zinc-cadmium efflux system protein
MSRGRRLQLALILNLVLVVAQVAFGVVAHSLGLLSDAGHNLSDVAALALALIAVRLVRRSPDPKRSFGYHRSTILAAQANAAMLLMVTALILYEGVRRLMHPVAVHGLIVVVVASVALIANLAAALLLDDHSHDLNMRAAWLHMVGDTLSAAGVIAAGLVIVVTDGNYWLDPAVSIVIGLGIAYRAVGLLRETASVLLESTPLGLDLDELTAAITGVAGVEAVHDLHTWSLSSEFRALSAHVVLEGDLSLEDAQRVGERIKATIGPRFEIVHATLELECEACQDDTDNVCVVDTFAATPHSH